MRAVTSSTLFIICLAVGIITPLNSQTSSSASPQKGESVGETAPVQPEATEQTQGSEPTTAPVLWVSSVEALRSTHGGDLDIVRVRGLSSTEGWEGVELVPLTKGNPADGMLDLALVAQAPSNSTVTTNFPSVEAIFILEAGHPYKGVRVHSATNRITLKALPGYADAAAPPNDCSACVGKYFVAKGQAAPAGAKSGDIMREESLPKTLRVVRADDGLRKLDSDPNRLTLLLDDDGRIAMAVWD